jgi:hypothetical protein
MTKQTSIKDEFYADWNSIRHSEKDVWLVKGDFDHFKLINDLYGSLITDYLLDWSVGEIENEIQKNYSRWGVRKWECNVMGDDITIYIPPTYMTENNIHDLLVLIRNVIKRSFWRRYIVGLLPLSEDFFDDVPAENLSHIRTELDQMEAVLDFARRQNGYLLLMPTDLEHGRGYTLSRILEVIQHWAGKNVAEVRLNMEWVYNPDDQSSTAYGDGFVDPPEISFAACSTRRDRENNPDVNGPMVFERLARTCQITLKTCKKQRSGVLIHQIGMPIADVTAPPVGLMGVYASSHLHWYSERRLREILYFKILAQPVLFQFNPVYQPPSGERIEIDQPDKYRGNQHGIGLKGINEFFGQVTGDHVILELLSLFSKQVNRMIEQKSIPKEDVLLAQFVDRFTLCCALPILDMMEIMDLVRDVALKFNANSKEIKISHLRTHIVLGECQVTGYRLFNHLALTSLTPTPTCSENTNPGIAVRLSCSPTLLGGRAVLEKNSFNSAQILCAAAKDK